MGRNNVKNLMHHLNGRGYIVTTNNFFTFVPLILDLLESGTMATSTLRGNRKYISKAMFAKAVTKFKDIGWVDYKMHQEMKVYCVVWKDKQPAVLLSTHAEPMLPPGVHQFVWHKFEGHRKKVQAGPMHLQYTRNVRGVDTVRGPTLWYIFITYTVPQMVAPASFLHIGHHCCKYVDLFIVT